MGRTLAGEARRSTKKACRGPGCMGKAGKGMLALLLSLAMILCGCEARPGTNVTLKPGKAPVDSAAPADRPDKAGKTGQEEKEPKGTDKKEEASVPEIDPEEQAQKLLDERIGELCFYYTGNFDAPDPPNTAQVYWSVFKWYSLGKDYKAPDKPDYTGYEQLDTKTVRKLIERWYGPDIPEYEGNLSALGDPATGELINVSENGNTCYFLEVEMPMEETHVLQSARVDEDGILTMRFNAQDGTGGYLRTYLCKLRPDGEGGYYLCSLNKGQS